MHIRSKQKTEMIILIHDNTKTGGFEKPISEEEYESD